ncbi:hypothetical protein [Microbispora sp. CSR-4]|uniref:hypothetical protein n=1 Tax=Microbispora TaxID=2005 RepID=UPI00164F53A6|nr:hypothetical protein [Microbispora sp. CSR-4]
MLVAHALLARALEVHALRPADAASSHDGLPSVIEDSTSRRDASASDHAMVFTRLSP